MFETLKNSGPAPSFGNHKKKHFLHQFIPHKLQNSVLARDISVGYKRSSRASEKKTVRAIFKSIFNALTNDYFKQGSTLKSNELHKFDLCCHLSKILQEKKNYFFAIFSRFYSEFHSQNTKNNSLLITHLFKLTTSQYSITSQ